jgi:hypothetical protein
MIWLSIVSLAAGALLTKRFKIIGLVPATFMIVLFAIGVISPQTQSVWSILGIIAVASVCIQIGYFVGLLIHHSLRAPLASRSSSFSALTSARDPVR